MNVTRLGSAHLDGHSDHGSVRDPSRHLAGTLAVKHWQCGPGNLKFLLLRMRNGVDSELTCPFSKSPWTSATSRYTEVTCTVATDSGDSDAELAQGPGGSRVGFAHDRLSSVPSHLPLAD